MSMQINKTKKYLLKRWEKVDIKITFYNRPAHCADEIESQNRWWYGIDGKTGEKFYNSIPQNKGISVRRLLIPFHDMKPETVLSHFGRCFPSASHCYTIRAYVRTYVHRGFCRRIWDTKLIYALYYLCVFSSQSSVIPIIPQTLIFPIFLHFEEYGAVGIIIWVPFHYCHTIVILVSHYSSLSVCQIRVIVLHSAAVWRMKWSGGERWRFALVPRRISRNIVLCHCHIIHENGTGGGTSK